jgi:hypothetical protein
MKGTAVEFPVLKKSVRNIHKRIKAVCGEITATT